MLTLILPLFLLMSVYPQNPEWIQYTNGNYINSIHIEGDEVWVGTGYGLVNINKCTGKT